MRRSTSCAALLCLILLFLCLGCTRVPDHTVERVEIKRITRSFPDKDDWLHVVEGEVTVSFSRAPSPKLLEQARNTLGVALYVYTKGNAHPMYFFQYISGEPNTARIAFPYVFEPEAGEDLFTAAWELTDIYFGDEEFNDQVYEAVALAGDRTALERLTGFMSMRSLLNLPNQLNARLVFSEPFGVERGTSAELPDSEP